MSEAAGKQRPRGARKLSELVNKALDPVIAKRGFATADLIASWAEIVGARHATSTAPEKIVWPRGTDQGAAPGMLVLRVDGPRAILVQHELGQIIERVNAFFGYAAIGSARIVQGPVSVGAKAPEPPVAELDASQESTLATTLSQVEGDDLRAALDRLGRGILAKPFKDT